MRPPTDDTCFGNKNNPNFAYLYDNGICPTTPRRDMIQKSIGESRGYVQVARPGSTPPFGCFCPLS